MTDEQFNKVYYPKYLSAITGIARKLGGRDDALVEDLVQEGLTALWLLDLKKVASNEDAYIRQSVKFKMIDSLRRFNPAAYESLDARLMAGDQLEHDDDTGELFLRSENNTRRAYLDDSDWELREETQE